MDKTGRTKTFLGRRNVSQFFIRAPFALEPVTCAVSSLGDFHLLLICTLLHWFPISYHWSASRLGFWIFFYYSLSFMFSISSLCWWLPKLYFYPTPLFWTPVFHIWLLNSSTLLINTTVTCQHSFSDCPPNLLSCSLLQIISGTSILLKFKSYHAMPVCKIL